MIIALLAQVGDNIISTSNLYGGTYNQFKVMLPRLGITTKFVKGDKAAEFEKLIDDKTKAVYLESIGNPRYNVPDFEAIVKVAHAKGVPVVVCICTSMTGDLLTHSRSITRSALEGISVGHSTMELILSATQPRNGLADTARQ